MPDLEMQNFFLKNHLLNDQNNRNNQVEILNFFFGLCYSFYYHHLKLRLNFGSVT